MNYIENRSEEEPARLHNLRGRIVLLMNGDYSKGCFSKGKAASG